MRLALFTNIPSHYMISLGEAFAARLNGRFAMVCWEASLEEYQKLGWDSEVSKEWLIRAWMSKEDWERGLDILRSADVVVWGAAPVAEINKRVESGKLTFRYAERFLKQRWRILDPRIMIPLKETYRVADQNNYHLLAVGPYCADDFDLIGAFRGRRWRWGYFPEFPEVIKPRILNSEPIVLWAGRMLSWKRVDLLLRGAALARAQGGVQFRLRLVGRGPEEDALRALAAQLQLSDICEFLGPVSPTAVGTAMEEADIYMFPSSRHEGWGVVVNEAMSRGCCVIGSKSTGAVPWLISDGANGRVFEGESAVKLGRILRWCLDNPEQRYEMGQNARSTISEKWSPSTAAERMLTLCEALEEGRNSPFQDGGPCAPAF